MLWIVHDPPFLDGSGEADGDSLEIPAFDCVLQFRDELPRSHARSGIELPLIRAREHELDVGAPNVDDKYRFLLHETGGALIGVSLTKRAFFDSTILFGWLRDLSRKKS